jgi:hypothetical protein
MNMQNFRPINAHGKLHSPTGVFDRNGNSTRQATPAMEPLYQVHVETHAGYIPVGPKCGQRMAEQFMIAINRSIAKGMGTWSNPTLVQTRST